MPERYEYPPTEFDPKPGRASAARGQWFYFPLLLGLSAFVAIASTWIEGSGDASRGLAPTGPERREASHGAAPTVASGPLRRT